LDLRLAEYLQKYKLSGTFYIVRNYRFAGLTQANIRALSRQFEIGAHSLTHPDLTRIPVSKAREEINGSRAWLQSVIGAPINAFCYPEGAYNPEIRALVADAGFAVARTVKQYRLDCGSNILELPTTCHVYPFPLRPVSSVRARFEPVRMALPHVFRLRLSPADLRSWPALALALLERAAATGGIWHLWGHSWEIEKYGMWAELETVLSVAASYPDAQVVTNSELASLTTIPTAVSLQSVA
jgi:hypothetical protein